MSQSSATATQGAILHVDYSAAVTPPEESNTSISLGLAAPTEIFAFEVCRLQCSRLLVYHNGKLNTKDTCGDITVDTDASLAILVSAAPVNAIDLVCDACSSAVYKHQRPTTFPSCSTEPSGYDAEQFSEFQIKKEVDTFGYGFDSYAFSEFCDDDNKFLKRRGPRTTIKQNQLDVLNRIFSSTPKPSKHARAKLALETGLSMRVIQVWFQNRRSKERRLKHLCNYLRHYEQRGLLPPPIQFTAGEGGSASEVTSFSQYLSGIEGQFDEDEEED
ncbi:hypothetical protein Y032_0007g3346 [Ancylostoma ceylanicum]|uniref:Homeobox domain-containing protein n=1 Tax=Ancylostoma ceylanicum TaxID=53326 RepID=A0A016VMX8_9BILA|nr:hypothetical protein Y032_0007g3346 [Ancylostoma ceylanicum]